jgi:hypothetical protein
VRPLPPPWGPKDQWEGGMAAHAPRGAENDLPQARPVRIFFDFFRIFCRHGADIGLFNEFCRDLGFDFIGDFF